MRWKTILWVLVIAVFIDLGFMLVPPYIENFKLDAELEAMARHARIEKSDDVLKASIQKEAETLGIAVHGDNIQITRDEDSRHIEIAVSYERIVEFWPFGLTTSWHFSNNVVEKL